jgi:hypothetical protein
MNQNLKKEKQSFLGVISPEPGAAWPIQLSFLLSVSIV